jgi:hypothetical protein
VNAKGARLSTLVIVSRLVEQGIDKNSSTSKDPFLIGCGIFWKTYIEGVRIGKDFGHGALGLFENEALVLLTTLVTNFGLVNAERRFAAALSTRVSFGTTVDAHSTQARWRVNEVEIVVLMVVDLERRNTKNGNTM